MQSFERRACLVILILAGATKGMAFLDGIGEGRYGSLLGIFVDVVVILVIVYVVISMPRTDR